MADGNKTQIYIVYYSMYGHVRKLAEEIKRGIENVKGVEAKIFQVPETMSPEMLAAMHAPPKSDDPIIAPRQLANADGILFGVPTRFGSAAAQMKMFMDTTGDLWLAGSLIGKTAGVFVSSGSLGGGMEMTAFTFLTHFASHGMIIVPMGCGNPALMDMKEAHGGSQWGAGTLSGDDGLRQPSALEMSLANYQGENFAKITQALKLGRELHS